MTATKSAEQRPWDQNTDEPDTAYTHFTNWLALNDRNLVTASKAIGLSYGRIKDLSYEHNWKTRAAAHDQQRSREIADATAQDRMAAARAIAQDIRETAEARLHLDPDDRDPAGVQKLATALKAITPALDDPAPAQTVKLDIEGLYTAVRLREQQREEDEEDTA